MKRIKEILEIMNEIPFDERTPEVVRARHYVMAEYDRLKREEYEKWFAKLGGFDHADET